MGNPDFDTQMWWAVKRIQPLAEAQIYSIVWPDAEIIPLDTERGNQLKRILDVAGADKLIKYRNGNVNFLAQRFRKHNTIERGFDDFTLRKTNMSGYRSEIYRVLEAFKQNQIISAYYAYGHANKKETGFTHFRILDFKKFVDYLMSGKIRSPKEKDNNDPSSFYAWKFEWIPRDIFIYDLNPTGLNQKSLVGG